MQENHRNGQDDSDIVATIELFTITRAALTDALFRLRAITGSRKGQRINRKVISQPVVLVQKIVRNFWRVSCELENACCKLKWMYHARNYYLCYGVHVHAGTNTIGKQILYHQIVRKDVHFRNWYTCKIGILLSAVIFRVEENASVHIRADLGGGAIEAMSPLKPTQVTFFAMI